MESHRNRANDQQEGLQTPFNIEEVRPTFVPNVEIKKGALFVNGTQFGNYGHVGYKKIQTDGIVGFESEAIDDNLQHKNFIDPANPDRIFPSIDIDDKKEVFVRGSHWDSLSGKEIYFGGTLASIDPVTESIVFRTSAESHDRNRENEVIVNNIPWKNTFAQISFAESYNGKVLVIAKKQEGSESDLFVNDRQWIWPRANDQEISRWERVTQAATNGNDLVVAMVSSSKKDKALEYVYIGDTHGYRMEWNTAFDIAHHDQPNKIIVDKESDTIAVLGSVKGVRTLVINDVICNLTSIPHTLEKISISKGVVSIQYKDAIGKHIAEKISLNENARELQEQNGEHRAVEEALYILRKLLHEKGSNPHELVGMTLKYADLLKEKQKLELEVNKIHEFQNRINVLEKDNEELRTEKVNLEQNNMDLVLKINTMQTSLQEIENLLVEYAPTKGKGLLGKKSGMDEAIHKQFHTALKKEHLQRTNSAEDSEKNTTTTNKKEATGASHPNKAYSDLFG